MADVAILTALFGGGDIIRPQAEQDIEVDWIAVTGDPATEVPAPWRPVVKPSSEHPCVAAKRYKTQPWRWLDHSDIIWIDANMEVTAPGFAREALGCRNDGVAVSLHPRRDCIYDEAEASLGRESQGGKYDGLPIREQVEHYRREGHPEHGGLYACGTLAWDATDARARLLGAEWMAECERWTFQDQISFPVVARRQGITPGVFPHSQIVDRAPGYLANPWLRIHRHL